MKKTFALFLVLFSILGCIKEKEKEFSNNNLYSTLWMQSAAEYKANSIQVYQAATAKLADLISDNNYTAIPQQKDGYQDMSPAIILDVDETVLDNSPYQAKLVMENQSYSRDTWNQWVSLKQAKALPGVVHFLNSAQEMGVTIFYITNRRCTPVGDDLCPQDQQTFENLQNIGINNVTLDNVLLRDEQEDWTGDKTSRRTFVAEKYRVIMLFGDNLGDFVADTAKTLKGRNDLINEHSERWGNSWFMLANPSYGGWLNVLDDPDEVNLVTY